MKAFVKCKSKGRSPSHEASRPACNPLVLNPPVPFSLLPCSPSPYAPALAPACTHEHCLFFYLPLSPYGAALKDESPVSPGRCLRGSGSRARELLDLEAQLYGNARQIILEGWQKQTQVYATGVQVKAEGVQADMVPAEKLPR
ncbi:hypothetical protein PAAG_12456 [Paracoccidioides lutzii Pb01]|uniref:Uncharacterized protein n=1 Tax=Paracoccidioides lutzii (strain ATCC MYA-826 / Pb01) TaxID=502779 RepID=A0A0A2V030_PARBA|nr:hypothetical protein PAAG_12456 [Paracoccidioides lutzii Pb01]KGQ00868.1 hypothetical protein PAAG_12456 [Paracoccidioides lutzii Pb01]